MNAAVAKPAASTLFWSALMTLPLLMPGARRRYGTIPVAIGVIGLGRQLYSWMQARRQGPVHELRAAAHDADITRTPHLRGHLE
jgi:hypothetical protein